LHTQSATKIYQVWHKKSNPLKFVSVFSATACNLSAKFYLFMRLSYLYLNAKQNLIIFKYIEVFDILT